MRRSRYGYLLLALLVITGLAGTITSTSLTSKERKFAANHLKGSKSDVMKSLKDLSAAQLDFKAAPDKLSIRECVFNMAISEKNFWQILNAVLTQPANPQMRSEIKLTDEQIISMVDDCNKIFKTREPVASKDAPFKSLEEAMETFKSLRNEHIKYVKTTTEDLRNHVIKLPVGWIDCYQVCLFLSAYSNRHKQQIEKIKADVDFPSR